jgi:DNA-directed RNA polymerase specialized sigma24 family protein
MRALLNAYYGKLERGFCFAGANAYRAEEIISVQETFARIVNEYDSYANKQSVRFDV